MRRDRHSVRDRREFASASAFYEEKLGRVPTNARYNNFQAILRHAEGNDALASKHYEQTIETKPHDVMARNDYALHLAKTGNYVDSVEQLNRALLYQKDQPTLHKNMSAVLARKGDLNKSLEHASRAVQLNPSDAMNHRNLARVAEALGDSDTALEHAMKAIELESQFHRLPNYRPNTDVFRSAAVQLVSKGGNREQAHALMDAARAYEGKSFVLPTSERTREIIAKINQRRGNQAAQLAAAAEALAEKERQLELLRAGHLPALVGNFKRDALQGDENT